MTGVGSSVIAVAGTLAGGVLATVAQVLIARVQRRESRRETRRDEALTAVTALAVALAAHRRSTWVARRQQLTMDDERTVSDAVAVAHETWSVVSARLVTVKILAPRFTAAAEAVTEAIWAMQAAGDDSMLETRRADAVAALDALMVQAAEVFTRNEWSRVDGRPVGGAR
ncbi:protein kilB [Actinophytocola sediminis]